jgi:L-seryl-tRNA(Ser) seleniumtransferase
MSDFRSIPSIDELRRRPSVVALETRFGWSAVVDALRAGTAAVRESIGRGEAPGAEAGGIVERIEWLAAATLGAHFAPSLQPVINATGVIVHTNLGRAPLSESAVARVAAVAKGYSTLEYDAARGERGRRDVHAEALLCRLTGAEAAVVVNNNAAATLLLLAALAAGREVIVSRGELVEIGGGFRVPDVMRQSGATLREVGTTNKTRAADYAAAMSERTALILRVHPSNFRIEGFTERPALAELVALGRRFEVPVAEDLGSGYLRQASQKVRATSAEVNATPGEVRATADAAEGQTTPGATSDVPQALPPPLAPGSIRALRRDLAEAPGAKAVRPAVSRPLAATEPAVEDSIAAGVGVCCFSGDKLLGGPQSGIIVGRRALVDALRRHPLVRALRVDKMTYAALEATLAEYAADRAVMTVPVQRMLAMTAGEIRARAEAVARAIGAMNGWRAAIVEGTSAVGGGSAPGVELPTWLVAIERDGLTPDALEARLRRLTPPVIARIEHDRVLLDLRTVAPDQDQQLLGLLNSLS